MSEGFIKIHRQLLDWEWYTDINTKVLFLHCLLKAYHQTKKFQNNTVKRGSFITSLESLSKETGLSIQQTRTALEHLISTGEITNQSTSRNRIITVVNYDKYQDVNKPGNKRTTSKQQTGQQANNKRATNNQQASNNSRRMKEVYVSPTEIHIQEEGEKTAAPAAADSAGGSPARWLTIKEMRQFARTIPDSTDDLACSFLEGFQKSGTAMPDDWKDIYTRLVGADPQTQLEFIFDLRAGKYRDKWRQQK